MERKWDLTHRECQDQRGYPQDKHHSLQEKGEGEGGEGKRWDLEKGWGRKLREMKGRDCRSSGQLVG